MGQKLVQGWVQRSDRHGLALHDTKNAFEIFLLHGQQLFQSTLAPRNVFRKDHFPHGVDAVTLEEHVLGAGQPDTFRSESQSHLGLVGLVGIGPHPESTRLVGPSQKLQVVLVNLGAFRLEGLVDHDTKDFRRLSGYLPMENLAGGSIDGQPVPFSDDFVPDGHAVVAVFDFESIAAHHAHLAHLAPYQSRMRCHAAPCGEDALGGMHASNVFGRSFQTYQNDLFSSLCPLDGIRCVENDSPRGSARSGIEPLCQQPLLLAGLFLGPGIENGSQELIELVGVNPQERFLLGDDSLTHHIHGNLERGKAGTLTRARLQHPELAAFDSELDILHVPVMTVQPGTNLIELTVDFGHGLFQGQVLGVRLLSSVDGLGRANPRHNIFTLGIDEIFPIKHVVTGGGISGKTHTRSAIIPEVAEHHGLYVDRRSHVVGNVVEFPVGYGSRVVPGIEDRVDGSPELFHGVQRKVQVLVGQDERFITTDQLLEYFRRQLVVVLRAMRYLDLLQDLIERVRLILVQRLQAKDHIPIHGHETAIAVIGKTIIIGLRDQSLHRFVIEPQVEHCIHHARHTDGRAGTHGQEERVFGVSEFTPHDVFNLLDGIEHLGFELLGIPGIVPLEKGAHLRGDGESRRDGNAEISHFSQVRPFASEKHFVLGGPVGFSFPKKVHIFVCHDLILPLLFSYAQSSQKDMPKNESGKPGSDRHCIHSFVHSFKACFYIINTLFFLQSKKKTWGGMFLVRGAAGCGGVDTKEAGASGARRSQAGAWEREPPSPPSPCLPSSLRPPARSPNTGCGPG